MPSVLDHYNPHSKESKMEWEGLRSQRFGRTKYFLPHKDIISPGLDFPQQHSYKGLKHFQAKFSQELQPRSRIRIVPKQEHWHPRHSQKKIIDLSFTQAPPRRERGHVQQIAPQTERSAGIRTFYNTPIRERNFREYSVEDRMQRKFRIDQRELRRTFFLHENSVD